MSAWSQRRKGDTINIITIPKQWVCLIVNRKVMKDTIICQDFVVYKLDLIQNK